MRIVGPQAACEVHGFVGEHVRSAWLEPCRSPEDGGCATWSARTESCEHRAAALPGRAAALRQPQHPRPHDVVADPTPVRSGGQSLTPTEFGYKVFVGESSEGFIVMQKPVGENPQTSIRPSPTSTRSRP